MVEPVSGQKKQTRDSSGQGLALLLDRSFAALRRTLLLMLRSQNIRLGFLTGPLISAIQSQS
jgi:hypothetical protein